MRLRRLLRRSFRGLPLWCWILVLAIWVPLLVKGVRNLRDGNDFTTLHAAAVRVLHGEPVYDSSYMYPPFFAWTLLPLAPLSATVAGSIWALLKVPLFYLAAAAFLPAGLLPPDRRRLLIALSPALVYRFLDSDMVNGNTNVMLIACTAAAFHLVATRGRQFAGAAFIAAAAAVKLSPAYLAVCLGGAGRLRFAAISLVLLAAFLILPALPTSGGVQAALHGFTDTSMAIFDVAPGANAATEPGGGYLPGQSLRALLHRWLRPINVTSRHHLDITVNVLTLPPRTVEWFYRGAAALIALFGVLACRGRSLRWTFAWGAILLLLIAPYARKAQFVFLLPAMLLAVEACLARRDGWRRLLPWLVVCLVLGQLSTPALWGRYLSAWILGAGAVGGAAMAILPAMWIMRRQENVQETQPQAD